ncbi:hypothetical protein ACFTAO_16095 [Paenibacillus rhizoplanae]
MYECDSVTKLRDPKVWPQAKYAADSLLQWYAEVGSASTRIWASFRGQGPAPGECGDQRSPLLLLAGADWTGLYNR